MQSAATQDLDQLELDLLFQYNPPPRSVDVEYAHLCPELTPPLLFYEKHLANNLSLKKIEIIPLATHLSHAVDHTIQSLEDGKITLPSKHPKDHFPYKGFRASVERDRWIFNANEVARAYQLTIVPYSHIVASTLLFHVRAPGWFSVLEWHRVRSRIIMERFPAFDQEYTLQIRDPNEPSRRDVDAWEFLDEEMRAILQRIQKRYRDGLAYWGFFTISDEGKDVLKEMYDIASAGHFDYEICRTQGYLTPPITTTGSPDASITGWGVPVAALSTSLDRRETSSVPEQSGAWETPRSYKEQLSRAHLHGTTAKKAEDRSTSQKDTLGLLSNAGSSRPSVFIPRQKRATSSKARMFLQQAWAGAVERDSTYIILNCGNLERIGFRHRASQTLFLSDLIDVPHCKDPGYGKIHIGLYLSILQDVVDRTEQQRKQDEMLPPRNRKRRRGSIDFTPNKRYKTRGMVRKKRNEAEERRKIHQLVKKEADKRSLVLLELRYGVHNSPAPASFLRLDSARDVFYSALEYFSIVLTSEIAAGATGVAHGAYLEVHGSNGTVSRRTDVVVKLAFKPDQIERMRHEYSIYKHLASRGVVEGIPIVYGLFEDTETDTLALVMSNVGTALVTLLPDRRSYGATISESARAAYLRVLRTIHKAGVRHNDIRPENLTLSDGDQVAIIDFDMAELKPGDDYAKTFEMRDMIELLTGSSYTSDKFLSAAMMLQKESTPEEQPRPVTTDLTFSQAWSAVQSTLYRPSPQPTPPKFDTYLGCTSGARSKTAALARSFSA